jgi:hypothetical protein
MFMCLLRTAAQKNGLCILLGLPTGSERLDGPALDASLLYECYDVWLARAPGPDRELQTAEMLPLGSIGVSAPVLPQIMRRYSREVVRAR